MFLSIITVHVLRNANEANQTEIHTGVYSIRPACSDIKVDAGDSESADTTEPELDQYRLHVCKYSLLSGLRKYETHEDESHEGLEVPMIGLFYYCVI